jgi:hypothetical protein
MGGRGQLSNGEIPTLLAVCAVTAALLRDRTGTQAPEPVSPVSGLPLTWG